MNKLVRLPVSVAAAAASVLKITFILKVSAALTEPLLRALTLYMLFGPKEGLQILHRAYFL